MKPKSCSLCGGRKELLIPPYWDRSKAFCAECAKDQVQIFDRQDSWPADELFDEIEAMPDPAPPPEVQSPA